MVEHIWGQVLLPAVTAGAAPALGNSLSKSVDGAGDAASSPASAPGRTGAGAKRAVQVCVWGLSLCLSSSCVRVCSCARVQACMRVCVHKCVPWCACSSTCCVPCVCVHLPGRACNRELLKAGGGSSTNTPHVHTCHTFMGTYMRACMHTHIHTCARMHTGLQEAAMQRWAAGFEHMGRVLSRMGAIDTAAAAPAAHPISEALQLDAQLPAQATEGAQPGAVAQQSPKDPEAGSAVRTLGHVALLQRHALAQCLARADALLFHHLLTPPGGAGGSHHLLALPFCCCLLLFHATVPRLLMPRGWGERAGLAGALGGDIGACECVCASTCVWGGGGQVGAYTYTCMHVRVCSCVLPLAVPCSHTTPQAHAFCSRVVGQRRFACVCAQLKGKNAWSCSMRTQQPQPAATSNLACSLHACCPVQSQGEPCAHPHACTCAHPQVPACLPPQHTLRRSCDAGSQHAWVCAFLHSCLDTAAWTHG